MVQKAHMTQAKLVIPDPCRCSFEMRYYNSSSDNEISTVYTIFQESQCKPVYIDHVSQGLLVLCSVLYR